MKFDKHFGIFEGAGAVEYIICHAEISITFVEENKIPQVSNHCHITQNDSPETFGSVCSLLLVLSSMLRSIS